MGRAFHFDARYLWIALQAARTIADGSVVLYFAKSITATGCREARVLALLRDAGLIIWTVAVLQALI